MRLRPSAALACLAVLALLLAGCSNSPDGQTAEAEGSLAYNGASTGTHQSDPFECDGSANVHLSANVGSGRVSVSVRDSTGRAVFTRTVEGPGQTSDSQDASGTAGDWSISVTRSGSSGVPGAPGSFSGQYAIHVDC